MADWTQLGGVLGGGAALGALIQAWGNRLYGRGKIDQAARAADMSAAASIVRLEMTVNKLTDTVSEHVAEDAGHFGELKASVRAMEQATADMRETMRDAADGMRALTERLDRAISSR